MLISVLKTFPVWIYPASILYQLQTVMDFQVVESGNAVEMADALKAAIDIGKPSLLEVEVEPADSGMFEKVIGSVRPKLHSTRGLQVVLEELDEALIHSWSMLRWRYHKCPSLRQQSCAF